MKSRKFYANAYLYLGIGLLATFIGFLPSYFSKLGDFNSVYHFHGITATLWMLLLIIQPYLYKIGKLKYHRWIGWASIFLAISVILGGLLMLQLMIQGKDKFGIESMPYQIAFINMFSLFMFALFLVLAIKNRKDVKLHARYMVCTIFSPLNPAIIRIFSRHGLTDSFQVALTWSHVIPELILILLILDDKRKGKVRRPYIICLGLIVIQHGLMYFSGNWEWWRFFMNQFAGI